MAHTQVSILPREYVLTLPLPPSNNSYKRHFCTGIGKSGKHVIMAALTERARSYKEGAGWAAKIAGMRMEPVGEFLVEVDVYQTYRQEKANQMLDLDNIPKVLADALNGIAWADDRQIREWHLRRFMVNEGPHVDVRITWRGGDD